LGLGLVVWGARPPPHPPTPQPPIPNPQSPISFVEYKIFI